MNMRPLHRHTAIRALTAFAFLAGAAAAAAQSPVKAGFAGLTFSPYQVADPVFKEVYDEGGSMFGIAFGHTLTSSGNFDLTLAFDIRRLGQTGLSTVSQTETAFTLTPISAGLEASLTRGAVALWAGAGLGLFFYREDSEILVTSGSALGFHLGGGLTFNILRDRSFRLKLFLRWNKATATVDEIPVALGGAEYGLAALIGFRLF